MSEAPDRLLSRLLARRSLRPRRLGEPAPDASALERIVAAGLRGIDHGGLRPWRLLLIQDRQSLAEAFVAAEMELRPTAEAEALARARTRALAGPCVLAVIANIEPSGAPAREREQVRVPAREQWIALGAALQQMLLAADALGFAGSMLSGRKTETRALRQALALAEAETLVGFLTLGTPSGPMPKPAPAVDPQLFWSPWPPSPPSAQE